ncbi:vWA domain-containing protein [Teredinibacter turnerae]|uniref:vWA domain-containing protein n=1 Tax=Teredinibacter turnerae TaxID=2426 RepID=UPI0005F81579|nr:VWA domain-containing protein [Teredinibacter turnerae]
MNEDELKQRLAAQANTPIDPTAKRAAIAAAMNEFKRVHADQASAEKNKKKSQGIFHWLRLTSRSHHDDRSRDMKFAQQKWLLGSVATGCVAVFAVMLSLYNPDLTTPPPVDNPPARTPAALGGSQVNDKEVVEEVTVEEVTVTGMRASLQSAPETKHRALQESDAISAQDIGALPSHEAARSLQRFASPSASSEAKREALMRREASSFMPRKPDLEPRHQLETADRDRFDTVATNPIKITREEPVSTFSIDVDTASYSFVRRQLNRGQLPQKAAVRLEEMVNYFPYDYPLPSAATAPFKPTITVLPAPWNKAKQLVHIGIKALPLAHPPKANLVFLLDVSGSMGSPDKLPLVKQSMELLLSGLQPTDTVSIVVYAGAAGTVLEPTPVAEQQKILAALDRLNAGGSTAGAQGIELAYQLAEANYQKDAVNRIILATDGDFNVGIADPEQLKGYVERKRANGIELSILGFGSGNYNDALMQQLAQNGNGVAAYIDTLSEAQKVLVEQASGTLFTVAKDVKIQVEFNPATVAEYRLLGYETRALKREDFNNDAVDAGEIGAGHTVTAIYEITPAGSKAALVDNQRYAAAPTTDATAKIASGTDTDKASEYGFLKIRYKQPGGSESQLISTPIPVAKGAPQTQLREAQFGAAVAGFAQWLKDPRYLGNWSLDDALKLAQANKGDDPYGYRTEFVQLVRKAKIAKPL